MILKTIYVNSLNSHIKLVHWVPALTFPHCIAIATPAHRIWSLVQGHTASKWYKVDYEHRHLAPDSMLLIATFYSLSYDRAMMVYWYKKNSSVLGRRRVWMYGEKQWGEKECWNLIFQKGSQQMMPKAGGERSNLVLRELNNNTKIIS